MSLCYVGWRGRPVPLVTRALHWRPTLVAAAAGSASKRGNSSGSSGGSSNGKRTSDGDVATSGRPRRRLDASEVMTITSPTNDKVKLLKALHTKKGRDAEGLVLLEGHRQVIDAIVGGAEPSLVLFTDEAATSPLGEQLLDALQRCGPAAQLCRASDAVVQGVSDTVHGQGVVAAFPKPSTLGTRLPASPAPLIVLLDRPADPGNCGTIIRTAYGFGADAVVIADGCDAWSPKVLRSAMGMGLKLPVHEVAWADVPRLLADSYGAGVQVLLADADPAAAVYHQVDMTVATVVVIGSEATGIGKEALLLPGARKVRIPMAANRDLESLNAAVACSVVLGEIGRQRFTPPALGGK